MTDQWKCTILERLVQVEVVVPDEEHVDHKRGEVDASQDQEDFGGEDVRHQCCNPQTSEKKET